MRAIALAALSLFVVPSAADISVGAVEARDADNFWEVYQPGPDGLPKIPIAGHYFRFDETKDKFVPVFDREKEFNQIFIVWWKPWDGYGWITPQDTRRMAPGSKVQGYRIGMVKRALDWFELGRPQAPGTWTAVRDRSKPTVYRYDANNRKVVSEAAPPDWTTWGGNVEPPPEGAPSCTVTAVPAEAKVGDTVRFDVETKGEADALSMFGQELLLPRDFVEKKYDRAGVYDAVASVGRGTTRAACTATVRIVGTFAGGDDFGCTLTVEPQTIAPRQTAKVTLRTFGEVRRLEYLNVAMPVGREVIYRSVMNDKPGGYYVHAKVISRGEEKTCRMPFTVTANASER